MTDPAPRALWMLFEPLHDVTYFVPEGLAAFPAAGLRGFWRGYFAGRSAPLGPVAAEPVVALFYGFAPPMVARALPAVWELASPAQVLAALWHGATVLRELRGDGHVAALLTAGLTGLDALLLRAGSDLPRELLQPARGWTDEEWSAGVAGLRGRGLLDDDGRTTDAGRSVLDDVETVTDHLAAQPWQAAGSGVASRFAELVEPLSAAVARRLPEVSPVGVRRSGE